MSSRKRVKKNSYDVIFNKTNIIPKLLNRPLDLDEKEKNIIINWYNSLSKKTIKKIISENQIIPFAAYIFMYLKLDYSFWRVKYDFFKKRNLELKKVLDLIFFSFKKNNCNSVTLTENFAVLILSNYSIGSFSSGDIDLSADYIEKNKIILSLKELNFFTNDNSKSIGEYSGQSIVFYNKNIIKDGFYINIIWKPVTRAFLIQDKYEKRLKIARKNAIILPNTNIRILEKTSLLYFCALHISCGHYFTLTPGLRLYVDIDRLVRSSNIDWNKIKLWEKEDNAGIRVSLVLFLCNKIFNTPIPFFLFKNLNSLNSKILIKYLYKVDNNSIQNKSSKFRRLFIELLSDNTNIFLSFLKRINYFILKKNKIFK